MKQKLKCILLIDDSNDDNFFHKIIINKLNLAERIEVAADGEMALHFLKNEQQPPELILLDINMPRMNGWEFIEEYKTLPEAQKAKTIIVMLTTSFNPEDKIKSTEIEEIKGFQTKPLIEETLKDIVNQYFPEYQ